MRQVVCMKWGDKFAADDVNRLYRMVRGHVDGALRMACFTDDARGIVPEVECHPLPAVPVVGERVDRGWRKLGLFGQEVANVFEGEVLYLDLDIAIVQRLDPFFDWPGEFLIIKDFKPLRYRHRFSGNSSVVRFRAGAHRGLIGEVLQRGASIRTDYRDEQEFVSDYMRRHGVLRYWPAGWCASFKHDCVRPLPFGLWRAPRLPEAAKVVVFHGRPKPDEAIAGVGSKWYRPLLPAPWLRHYLD
ncbi:glycosyltransferase [Lysobacter yangpyeongensis]|uniref:Glycosyltransferase n=1 Tax=Lysobacter yangpyeongensis TaxID=346182 RepID=A0ABW0SPA7_9GAMM